MGGSTVKISSFKKGFGAFRSVLNGRAYSRQFTSYGYSSGGSTSTLIWNCKTDNVVAFRNRKGTVFVRPNSIYLEALKGKYKVVEHPNLSEYRSRISTRNRKDAKMYLELYKASDNIIKNKDKPNSILLMTSDKLSGNEETLIHILRSILKHRLPAMDNTMRSLKSSNIIFDGDFIYLVIQDCSEELRVERLKESVKLKVVKMYLENKSRLDSRLAEWSPRRTVPVLAIVSIEDKSYRVTINTLDLSSIVGTPSIDQIMQVTDIRDVRGDTERTVTIPPTNLYSMDSWSVRPEWGSL